MSAYSGRCEISVADDQYTPANVSLCEDGSGCWYGRITCATINWLVVQHRGRPITIRFPDGRVGTATVARFTDFLPAQVTVTGVGSPPW
jgi:hypothetical protein